MSLCRDTSYRGHILCGGEHNKIVHSCFWEVRSDISGLALAGWQCRGLFRQHGSCSDAKQRCSQTL